MALDWTINKFSPSLGLERSDKTNCIMSNGNLKRRETGNKKIKRMIIK